MSFLCDLPWIHLSVMPHGVTSICCEANHKNNKSHAVDQHNNLVPIHNNSVEDVVNSESYKQIREAMLAGRVPEACKGCHKIEKAGGVSKRLKDSSWKFDWKSRTAPDGSITPDIRALEIRLGNLCNLKCRSCNAESSSSWIPEYYKFKDQIPLASGYEWIKKKPEFTHAWTEDPDFYEKILNASPNLENIYISGGEPFLVPKHFDFIKRLRDSGNTDLHISYHTNLNYDIEKLRPHLDVLRDFRSVKLNLSIDDVGERNSYIRNPSNWDLTIKNLDYFHKQTDLEIEICQTVNVYNFMYIEELYKLIKDIPIYYNHVHAPAYQSAFVLDLDKRKQKLSEVKNIIPENLYNGLMQYNEIPSDPETVSLFTRYTKMLDQSRKENFEQIFPKTASSLGVANV